jgi:tRNA dimethylallyltransferase
VNQSLVVLLGQTAVGKTSLSLQLAQELNGEIISADSRLFYRGMDIGTAKPTATEQAQAPHHLIDLCTPDETITLGGYQRRAYQTIEYVLANGRLPILVGGTGQYVKAVVEGWGIPEVPPHPRLRAVLAQLPGPELARWLAVLDPDAAQKHDPRNLRRVIRALEVTLVTGRPISELQRKTPPPYRICQIGLTRPREELYARIDTRVDQMMDQGLLAELGKLRGLGYGRSLPSMSGLGYRQLWAYLEGEMSLEEAVERIKFETHRFARHQANWFQPDDPAITWFVMEDGVETAVIHHVQQWLKDGETGNGHTPLSSKGE